MSRKKWNIRSYVGRISIGFLGLIPIFIAAYYISYRIIVDEALYGTENSVAGEVARMDKWVVIFEQSINVLGTDLTIQNNLSSIKKILDVHVEKNSSLMDIYLGLSDDRGISARKNFSDGWKATQFDWYKEAMEAAGNSVAITYVDMITGKIVVSFAQYIGKIEGLDAVLACDVEMTELAQQVTRISNQLYPGTYSFLTDEDDQILAYGDNYIMKDVEGRLRNLREHEIYKQYDLSQETVLIRDYDKVERYFIPKKLECGWILYAAIPKQAVTHLFHSRIVWIILAFLALILYNVYKKNKAMVMNDAKSSFLSHISHEMRTPMNAIIGLSELLLKRDLDADVFDDVQKIQSSSKNLLEIVNNLLDISAINSGKLKIAELEYYLSSMLYDVITIISLEADKKNLRFTIDVDEDVPGLLIGDAMRIRQILINLLSNSIKYTDKGTIALSIHSKISEKEVLLIMEVRDTGVGIKEEDIPKLFDDFERFDSDKNINVQGTGLGLAIVDKLCGLMEGKVFVSSVYGEGSTFTVEIKQRFKTYIKYAGTELHSAKGDPVLSASFFAPSANILIVDDISLNLEIASNFLSYYKMNIDTCESGREAVEMVKSKQYDIVFLDHMMMDMNGIEAAKKIRKLKGDIYKKLPIIALTANTAPDAKKLYINSGMNDFLTKPLDSDMLNKILTRWIPEHKKEYCSADEKQAVDQEPQIFGSFVQLLTKIPSLSVSQALETFGGSEISYEKIVRLTASTLPKSLEKLSSLHTIDVEQYKIELHSLKSVLKNIGAYSIAETAETLENSCGLHELLKDQINTLLQLLLSIVGAGEDEDKPTGDISHVYEALPEIEEFVSYYNRDSALEAIDALLKYSYNQEIDAALLEINYALEMFNFRKAKEIIVSKFG